MTDPLSSLARSVSEEQEDKEDISLDDDAPAQNSSHAQHKPAAKPAQSDDSEPEQFHHTRVDTVASYGQLFSTPSFGEHDPLFAEPDAAPDEQNSQPEAAEQQQQQQQHAAGSQQSTSTTRQSISGGPDVHSPLQITVSDPVKKIEQSLIPGVSGGFVTYRVATQTRLPGFASSDMAVRRRFRDFVALADLLKATHRGYFIPPRPEKNTVEGQRASSDFLEGRRLALERYLQQLATHPVISGSQELRVFLEAEGPLGQAHAWQSLQPLQNSLLDGVARLPKQLLGQDRGIPGPAEAAQSTKASGDLLRRFKEMGQAVRNDYREPPILSDTEVGLRNDRLAVDDFAERVANASRKAEKAVDKLEETGGVLGDLGMALIRLGKFESEDGSQCGSYSASASASRSIAADTTRVGKAAVRLSRLSKTAVGQTTIALEPLHDHLALAPAIGKALKEREAALLTLQAIEDERERKKRASAGLQEDGQRTFGGDKKKTAKAETLQNDVAALDAAAQAAQGEYDRITERNQEELKRWRGARAAEFAALLDGMIRVELGYQERTRQVWTAVADEFKAPQSSQPVT